MAQIRINNGHESDYNPPCADDGNGSLGQMKKSPKREVPGFSPF
jgi:hypothetical protein